LKEAVETDNATTSELSIEVDGEQEEDKEDDKKTEDQEK